MKHLILLLTLGLPLVVHATPAADVDAPPAAADEDDPDAIEVPPEPEGPPVPRVEVVFVGVNEDVYSLYGHAAMLVIDDADDDIEDAELFNFGVTAFTETDYVQKFLGGRVEFWGDSRRYGRQLRRWRKADRTVMRRVVNLDPASTRRLIEHLRLDVTPERRDYVYDTFRENCATRLRDYLDIYTGGAVFAALGALQTERSFRDDVRDAYAGIPPLLALTEVVPGLELDRPRTVWERAYLPAMLMTGLAMVTTDHGPLLGQTEVDHRRAGGDPRAGWIHVGQGVVGGFGALMLLFAAFGTRLPRRFRGALLAGQALGFTGLGILLIIVGLGSDWPDMQRNWLLLATPPTDLILLVPAFQLLRDRPAGRGWVRSYIVVRMVTTALLLASTPWDAVTGPIVPRLVALAGLILVWRMLDGPDAFERMPRPRRLLGHTTGRYPAASDARRRPAQGRRIVTQFRTCNDMCDMV